jgi:hypothetical protein
MDAVYRGNSGRDQTMIARFLFRRSGFFLLVSAITVVVTGVMIVKSKRLADFIDALSNEKFGWRGKWQAWKNVW